MNLLDPDFPIRSPLSVRGPADVPVAEQVAELRAELETRLTYYPRRVEKAAMSADAMARHLATWRAIIADHADDFPPDAAISWDMKVRELRRELDYRRAVYPKWIARAGHPLSATEATRKLECLDAIHWRYWADMFGAVPAGMDPRTWPPRMAHLARIEAARARRHAARKPADAAADRASAARWDTIAALATRAAGMPSDWNPVWPEAVPLSAHVAAQLDQAMTASTPSNARIGALLDLDRWLLRLAAHAADTPQEQRTAA